MKNKYLYWDNSDDIVRLTKSLCKGEVSIGTSDTVIGLMADLSKEGFDRLNEIKGRTGKPYIILLRSSDMMSNLVRSPIDKDLQRLIVMCWPGPLTLIFKAKETLPAWMKSKDGTIAIRVPDHQGLQAVMSLVGGLFSTSANTHGMPVPKDINYVEPGIVEKAEYIVTDRKDLANIVPSTILDCSGPELKVLREGAYSITDLERICGKRIF
jgi:L-threonylcarbamoyladenylate synthase